MGSISLKGIHEFNSSHFETDKNAMKELTCVYVGLGGNMGDRLETIHLALQKISLLSQVYELCISRFYYTTPVSSIPQEPYVNAACCFKTHLTLRELQAELQKIEKELGKKEKLKDAPRVIDLDILFYGTSICKDPDLEVPHPRWKERLFVVTPLADLTSHLLIPDPINLGVSFLFDVREYLQNFPNIHQEVVTLIPELSRNICTQYDSKNSPLVKVSL